jgi:hypothetical protein
MNKERRTTFLGDMIFIIILVLVIYLSMTLLSGNQITKLSKINNIYGVSQDNLIPVNQDAYIADLSLLSDNLHTKPIIDYINLNKDSIKINKLVNYNLITNNNCISRTLYLQINSFVQKQDTLLDTFEKLDSPKLNKIYWNQYIENLRDRDEYRDLKIEIIKLEICN